MKRFSHLQSFLVFVLALMGCGDEPATEESAPAIAECLVYYGDLDRTWLPTGFPVEVVIDTRVRNDHVALVLDAIDMWNDQLNTELLFATITEDTYAMHGECNFVTITTKSRLPDLDVGLTTYGRCAADHVDILTSPPLSAQEIRNIAAHELGHVLGVPHDDTDPTSIMYPEVSAGFRFISERSTCVVRIALASVL